MEIHYELMDWCPCAWVAKGRSDAAEMVDKVVVVVPVVKTRSIAVIQTDDQGVAF